MGRDPRARGSWPPPGSGAATPRNRWMGNRWNAWFSGGEPPEAQRLVTRVPGITQRVSRQAGPLLPPLPVPPDEALRLAVCEAVPRPPPKKKTFPPQKFEI